MQRVLLAPGGLALESLVDYEIRSSSRHRHFVSIVVMAAAEGHPDFRILLGDTIRDSDGFFISDGEAVLVMGETDRQGATRAVMRFKEKLDDRCDIRYGISCYPVDGHTSTELLAAGRGRAKRAREMRWGSVVADE